MAVQGDSLVPWPLLGADGPVAIVSGRVAYRMSRLLVSELRRARDNGETLDPELIATVRAIEAAGLAYANARILAALAAARQDDDQHELTEPVGQPVAAEGPPEPYADDVLRLPPPIGGNAGISTAAVAQRLGCSERNVRALADRGVLAGRRVGRTWVFDPVEVEEYAARRSATG